MLAGFPEVLNPNMRFIVLKNACNPLLYHSLGQSIGIEPVSILIGVCPSHSRSAMLMLFYLGALLILYIVTRYTTALFMVRRGRKMKVKLVKVSDRCVTWFCCYERLSLKNIFFSYMCHLTWSKEVKCWPITNIVCAFARPSRDASTVFFTRP